MFLWSAWGVAFRWYDELYEGLLNVQNFLFYFLIDFLLHRIALLCQKVLKIDKCLFLEIKKKLNLIFCFKNKKKLQMFCTMHHTNVCCGRAVGISYVCLTRSMTQASYPTDNGKLCFFRKETCFFVLQKQKITFNLFTK